MRLEGGTGTFCPKAAFFDKESPLSFTLHMPAGLFSSLADSIKGMKSRAPGETRLEKATAAQSSLLAHAPVPVRTRAICVLNSLK